MSPVACSEVEPAVALDVEDEVELGGRLVWQEVAHLDAGGVHAGRRCGRDAADVVDDRGDRGARR